MRRDDFLKQLARARARSEPRETVRLQDVPGSGGGSDVLLRSTGLRVVPLGTRRGVWAPTVQFLAPLM